MEHIEPQRGDRQPSQAEAILQSQTHYAGNHVVPPDQFRGAVQSFDAEEDFSGLRVVMDADVEHELAGDADFLGDVMTTAGESATM